MHVARQTSVWLLAAVLVSVPTSAQDAPPTSALTWLEDPGAFEKALRTEEVVELVELGTGVTNPWKATLAAGGLVEAFVWKDIKPGIYQGYWESYKAEIAAYELDRLLELNMTPPYVERRIDGELGAAGLWVDNAETWKSMGGPPASSVHGTPVHREIQLDAHPRQDVPQPHLQQGPESRKLDGGPRVEPHYHRQLARVYHRH